MEARKKINLDNYDTKPMDFTGCDPVIERALSQGLMIKCKGECGVVRTVIGYDPRDECYCTLEGAEGDSWCQNLKPIPKVRKRIMPAGKAIDTLLNHGYAFDGEGDLVHVLTGIMVVSSVFQQFGKHLDDVTYVFPSIIVEEVE